MLGGKESGPARCGDGSLSGFRWQSGWYGEWLLRFESRGGTHWVSVPSREIRVRRCQWVCCRGRQNDAEWKGGLYSKMLQIVYAL